MIVVPHHGAQIPPAATRMTALYKALYYKSGLVCYGTLGNAVEFTLLSGS